MALSNQQGKPEKKHSQEWFEALIIAAIFATVLRIFVVESYRIPTGSMENTLLAGDFLFVNKYVYGPKIPFTDIRLPGVDEVKRGDVIVFKYPKDRSMNYIKRCVAISGDTLEIHNRQLSVNKKPVALPPEGQFLSSVIPAGIGDEMIFPQFSNYNKDNYGPIRVPRKGDVIKLNAQTWPLYADLVADEGHDVSLQGRLVFIDGAPATEYRVQSNYYFAMGDNRDNSLDSRFWGFLPEKDLVGEALIVYWSWNPDLSILTNPVGKLASIRWQRSGMLIH
ncbi:signal peptidase I [Chlorobium sp. BLA1]|uniref:signal peptidase I n=1 Tax=Candidatus Chlorobium masyuteum TaxID=2716876 RepID=UPI00141E9996|nr:signal peptidase I [Candidatus Chlorobium masyuteum]NHQ61176.1 signal peptidase I [Candidatus Chlorobium masyuteum]NTU44417.1 signal peptidase I [Chlorobiaceae bacterium]